MVFDRVIFPRCFKIEAPIHLCKRDHELPRKSTFLVESSTEKCKTHMSTIKHNVFLKKTALVTFRIGSSQTCKDFGLKTSCFACFLFFRIESSHTFNQKCSVLGRSSHSFDTLKWSLYAKSSAQKYGSSRSSEKAAKKIEIKAPRICVRIM